MATTSNYVKAFGHLYPLFSTWIAVPVLIGAIVVCCLFATVLNTNTYVQTILCFAAAIVPLVLAYLLVKGIYNKNTEGYVQLKNS